jgi:hypothetical protein
MIPPKNQYFRKQVEGETWKRYLDGIDSEFDNNDGVHNIFKFAPAPAPVSDSDAMEFDGGSRKKSKKSKSKKSKRKTRGGKKQKKQTKSRKQRR